MTQHKKTSKIGFTTSYLEAAVLKEGKSNKAFCEEFLLNLELIRYAATIWSDFFFVNWKVETKKVYFFHYVF